MAVRSIVTYPDARLRAQADPVSTFDAALRSLADDLLDTLRAADGVGITAPHVGVATRLVVLALPEDDAPCFYVNPVLVWRSDDAVVHDEGSVSMPGIVDKVKRAASVRLTYRDLDGVEHVEEAEGFRAVCHQHEIDQLDGIFWLERLSALKRERAIARFAKAVRATARR